MKLRSHDPVLAYLVLDVCCGGVGRCGERGKKGGMMAVGDLIVSEYTVEGYDHPEMPVTIVRHTSPFYEGVKWAAKWKRNVLGKNGEWAYEPMPSSRDDEFYAMYRFDSVEDALNAVLTCADELGPRVIKR